MKAAVLRELGKTPVFEEFPEPVPENGEVLVNVKASAMTRVSRSRASGSHYDSYRQLPAIVGVDGVGVLENGERVFFGGCRPPYGTMSEHTVAGRGRYSPFPREIDDLTAAAMPNAALSSWLPLVYRAKLQPGETVLVLGATGVAGKLAVQVAKLLGAGLVVAAGRNEEVLRTLPSQGADVILPLSGSDEELFGAFTAEAAKHPFNIVLDYVWGHPVEVLINSLLRHNLMAEEGRIRLVSIGSVAGPEAWIPSAVLRSAGLEIYGTGGGSVSYQTIVDTMPQLWSAVAEGELRVDTEPWPLADVETAWTLPETNGRRRVLVP